MIEGTRHDCVKGKLWFVPRAQRMKLLHCPGLLSIIGIASLGLFLVVLFRHNSLHSSLDMCEQMFQSNVIYTIQDNRSFYDPMLESVTLVQRVPLVPGLILPLSKISNH